MKLEEISIIFDIIKLQRYISMPQHSAHTEDSVVNFKSIMSDMLLG